MDTQLPPGERLILAYFPSSTKAQAAVDEIKQMGIGDVQLDRVSRYGMTYDTERNYAYNDARTETGLTLYSADTSSFASNDARVLMGADPANSGMAADNYGVAGGKAWLVTVVTPKEKENQCESILEQHEGEF